MIPLIRIHRDELETFEEALKAFRIPHTFCKLDGGSKEFLLTEASPQVFYALGRYCSTKDQFKKALKELTT